MIRGFVRSVYPNRQLDLLQETQLSTLFSYIVLITAPIIFNILPRGEENAGI